MELLVLFLITVLILACFDQLSPDLDVLEEHLGLLLGAGIVGTYAVALRSFPLEALARTLPLSPALSVLASKAILLSLLALAGAFALDAASNEFRIYAAGGVVKFAASLAFVFLSLSWLQIF